MRSVLVTRPQPAADELADRLRAEGFDAVCAPLSAYAEMDFVMPDLSSFQAIAFTSAQAAILFGRRAAGRGLPVFCVGGATAQAAAAAGFSEILSADGGAEELAALIGTRRNRMDLVRILHVCGEDIAHDLGALLAPEGLAVERLVAYRMDMVDRLPKEAEQALKEGRITTVPLFSARAAACFVAILKSPGWKGVSEGLELICLSRRVAAQTDGLGWRAVRVAPRPEMDGILQALHDPVPERRLGRGGYTGPERRKPRPDVYSPQYTTHVAHAAQRRARTSVVAAALIVIALIGFLLAPELIFPRPPAPVAVAAPVAAQAEAPAAPEEASGPGPIDSARIAVAEGLAGATAHLPSALAGRALSIMSPAISAIAPATEGETEISVAAVEPVGADSLLRLLSTLQGLDRSAEGRRGRDHAAQVLLGALDAPEFQGDMNAAIAAARGTDPALRALLMRVEQENLGAAVIVLALDGLRSGIVSQRSFAPSLLLSQRLTQNAPPSVRAALAQIAPYAETGLGSLEALRAEFHALAADMTEAEILARQSETLWGKTVRTVLRFVRVRATGGDAAAQGDQAMQAVLMRTDAALGRGELDIALAEMAKISGDMAALAQPWMGKAQVRLNAQDTAVMLSQGILEVLAATAKGEPLTTQSIFSALAAVFAPMMPTPGALPLARRPGMNISLPNLPLPDQVKDTIRNLNIPGLLDKVTR